MKIIIEMEGSDPKLPAVLAAIYGAARVVVAKDPVPVVPKTTTPFKPEVGDPKPGPEEDEGNESAASSAAQDQPRTTAPSQASISAPSKDAGETKVDLPMLQALAAQLLQAGERRSLKSILDENAVKSLSTAPEDAYPKLFEALTEAVAALPAE